MLTGEYFCNFFAASKFSVIFPSFVTFILVFPGFRQIKIESELGSYTRSPSSTSSVGCSKPFFISCGYAYRYVHGNCCDCPHGTSDCEPFWNQSLPPGNYIYHES